MTFEEIIQKAGKQIEMDISYPERIGMSTILHKFSKEHIVRLKYSYSTNLLGSVMNTFELETKIKIKDINANININIIAKYNDISKTKKFGIFNIRNETYNADKRTYTYELCDKFLNLMVDYKPINIQFPCTIYNFFKALIEQNNLITDIQSLPNGDKIMTNDIYEGINYTYRDVLDDIAEATGSLFKIKNSTISKVELGTNEIVINDSILKNKNISMGEHFGAINTIVLSRAGESDNIYYPSELPQNPIEYKIIENQLMNGNNRSEFLEEIYNQINGIEFDTFDCELTGYGSFEPLSKIRLETIYNNETKVYNSYVFNNEFVIRNGYKETIYTELPDGSKTLYKYADDDDKKINQAYLIVDKQNRVINGLVSEVDENTEKIGQLELKSDEFEISLQSKADNSEVSIASIIGKINEKGSELLLLADCVQLANFTINNGQIISEIKSKYTYTETDVNKVRDYLTGATTLTDEEKIKYDINEDGEVTSLDYVMMKRIIELNISDIMAGHFILNSNIYSDNFFDILIGKDGLNNVKFLLGLDRNILPNLQTNDGDVYGAKVVYTDDYGTSSYISFSQSIKNAKFLDINFKTQNGNIDFVRIYNPVGKNATLTTAYLFNNIVYQQQEIITIQTSGILRGTASQISWSTSNNIYINTGNFIYITDVVAYF